MVDVRLPLALAFLIAAQSCPGCNLESPDGPSAAVTVNVAVGAFSELDVQVTARGQSTNLRDSGGFRQLLTDMAIPGIRKGDTITFRASGIRLAATSSGTSSPYSASVSCVYSGVDLLTNRKVYFSVNFGVTPPAQYGFCNGW